MKTQTHIKKNNLWYDEELGVGRFEVSGKISRDDLEELLEKYEKLVEEHGPVNWLDDFSGIQKLDPDARRMAVKMMDIFEAEKVAIMGKDSFVEVLIGFLVLFAPTKIEYRFFSDEKEAVTWLKSGNIVKKYRKNKM